ncbi:MAG: MBOAT family protein [Prevotella sp.]|nr:MBOAT family protein [Prevotella sp.]
MSFVSLPFLLFLPITFLIYWALAQRLRWQNLFVLLASYVFYGWWDWRFLFLIVVTTLSSYLSGPLIERGRHRRLIAGCNIALNVAILACFKYLGFFAESLDRLMQACGWGHPDIPTLRLILPVGISFYTFQSLSYTIDVYRRQIPATRDAVAFAAYISFFPQLVAGPIERATHLLPQLLRPRTFCYAEAVEGLQRILWGFFKKVVVADNCALAVNQIWTDWATADSPTLLLGMLLFTFQIYGDFSGYSDIAIGTARLFGIRLSDNFRLPYFSRTPAEFWRRWHISLMSWFRDYVYIPLGGSRGSRWLTLRNTLCVFLLSGLWHGANWTFVAWGAYSALFFIPAILSGKRARQMADEPSWWELPRILLTFAAVAVGWVLFRSATIPEAIGYLTRMLTAGGTGGWGVGKQALLWCVLLLTAEWLQRRRPCVLQLPTVGWLRHPAVRWMIYYVVLCCVVFMRGEEQTFIYFQF